MLVSGAFMVATIVLAGSLIHRLGPSQPVPWRRAWQYAIWALQQEFILQSFFYVRLESLLGSRRGAWGGALLFSAAHLPSPVLTVLSLIGGLLFCEMFRRYRNLFPLGVVHAILGLTIAARLPDSLLRHMRVGLGYLLYRP
jgi:membrane protease YdiL (CAAX protease family)